MYKEKVGDTHCLPCHIEPLNRIPLLNVDEMNLITPIAVATAAAIPPEESDSWSSQDQYDESVESAFLRVSDVLSKKVSMWFCL